MAEANQYDVLRRVEAVCDELEHDLESYQSMLRYLSDVRQFYDHLVTRHGAAFNPAENVDHAEIWDPTNRTTRYSPASKSASCTRPPRRQPNAYSSSRCVHGTCGATRSRRCTTHRSNATATIHISRSTSARTGRARSR
ncbi:hypothetical protein CHINAEXTREME_07855 [Halobiforma lacisalsi AJ5]|uniref:Uncharacterized protein n=1 Tax=Natronobacterium lacisalsi AJ5 TaxID=358396 RepID=A0A1P8LPI5_NATLA|nr:hypothetical protein CHINAEXTREME_07855 [Halobiforma lacisalsi AJ5]